MSTITRKQIAVKIFESNKNKNKIYYAYIDGICGRFLRWGIPIGGSMSGDATSWIKGQVKSLDLKLDSDLYVLKDENKMIFAEIKAIKAGYRYMKMLFTMFFGCNMLLIMCHIASYNR